MLSYLCYYKRVIYTYSLFFMKNILWFLLIASTLLPLWVAAHHGEVEHKFVVTAYYSPLPHQENYLTWNYEREKILNGQWIRWASGKEVFSGMLAAPAKYSFGTKVYLEWLGVWSVEDRGWAIVPAWKRGYSHDRIDIWVGYGDEGLKRALSWGKRTVTWYIVAENIAPSIDYKVIASPDWATAMLTKNIDSRYNISVPPSEVVSSAPKKVPLSIIQKNLIRVNILPNRDDIPNLELVTKHALKQFQIKYGVIDGPEDQGAGVYGPATQAKMSEVLSALDEIEWLRSEFDDLISSIDTEAEAFAGTYLTRMKYARYKWIWANVRALQEWLADLGYFKQAPTWVFGDVTFDALAKFQIDNALIETDRDLAAGIFGPKTQETMKNKLFEMQKDILWKHHNLYTKQELLLYLVRDFKFVAYDKLKGLY